MPQNINEITRQVKEAGAFIPALLNEIEKVLAGQKYLTERLILGLLTGEYILVEGVPGLARTTAVKTPLNRKEPIRFPKRRRTGFCSS